MPQTIEEKRAAARARYHRRRAADPEKVAAQSRASSRAYHRRNPEDPQVVRDRVRAWEKANPEKVRAKARRRQGRIHPGDEWWASVLERDPCCYCGDPGGTVEHIVPMSAGGGSEPDNLAGACLGCNSAKQAKSLLLFLATRRRGGGRTT